MATRTPPRREIVLKFTGLPASIDEDKLKAIMAEAVAELTPPATRPAKKRPVLANRLTRKAQSYPCRVTPHPLWAAAITWPKGVPKQGCGRTYVTAKRRDEHESGKGWNPITFPHACLDRILPAELRDGR